MVVAWYVSRVGGLGLDEIPLPWIHTYHVLALLGGLLCLFGKGTARILGALSSLLLVLLVAGAMSE